MSVKNLSDPTILKIFRNHKYKATPQRLAIARYLFHNQEHPTALEIFADIREEHSSLSLTTVYKTVHFLKEINFVQEVDLDRGQARFDPNTNPHAHLVCMECGAIMDYMGPSIKKLNYKIIGDSCLIMRRSNFETIGFCDERHKSYLQLKAL